MPLLQPNQVGIREELADYIAIVDQKSTPFVSMAPKGKDLGNVTFSWQVDNYATPTPGGVVDGTDVTYTAGSPGSPVNPVPNRTRLTNYAQVFRNDLRIGFIANTQDVAGVGNGGEIANGISKRLIELKRKMESTFLCSNQAIQADNGTNPYLTASLGQWLKTTNSAGLGAPTSSFAPASGARSTTTTSAFTEATAQNVMTAIYGATGTFRDYDVFLGANLKRAFTNLTAAGTSTIGTVQVANTNTIAAVAVRTFNQELGSDTFKASVDIFEGDFGRLILHPDVWVNSLGVSSDFNYGTSDGGAVKGYVVPMEMVEIRYAKMPEVTPLPNNGGGEGRLIQAIAGLVVKNPNGFGMFDGAS
jgi:hypothetical protein